MATYARRTAGELWLVNFDVTALGLAGVDLGFLVMLPSRCGSALDQIWPRIIRLGDVRCNTAVPKSMANAEIPIPGGREVGTRVRRATRARQTLHSQTCLQKLEPLHVHMTNGERNATAGRERIHFGSF